MVYRTSDKTVHHVIVNYDSKNNTTKFEEEADFVDSNDINTEHDLKLYVVGDKVLETHPHSPIWQKNPSSSFQL